MLNVSHFGFLAVIVLSVGGCLQSDGDGSQEGSEGDLSFYRELQELAKEYEEMHHEEEDVLLTVVPSSLDVTGNGYEDVLLVGTRDANRTKESALLLINNEGESWSVVDLGFSAFQRDYTTADFSGDGRLEIYLADHGHDVDPFPGTYDHLLTTDEGEYLNEITSDRLPDIDDSFSHSVCSGDFNASGHADIYVGDLGDPYMLANNGVGTFQVDPGFPDLRGSYQDENGDFINRNLSFTWCAAGDFSGNGLDDLILGSNNTTETLDPDEREVGRNHFLLFNEGALEYRYPESLIPLEVPEEMESVGQPSTIGMVAEDLTGNGCLDFATLVNDYESGAFIEIFHNDCAGGFSRVQEIGDLPDSIFRLDAVDIAETGDIDLVTAATYQAPSWPEAGNTNFVLENQGDGTFQLRPGTREDVPYLPLEIVVSWLPEGEYLEE